jgi:hypothetical protein
MASLQLRTALLHLCTGILRLRTESLQVRTGILHLRTASLRLRTASLRVYAEPLSAECEGLAGIRVPSSPGKSLKSLNSKCWLGHTYLRQSSCSRASEVTAPVRDREATRVRLRRELGNC